MSCRSQTLGIIVNYRCADLTLQAVQSVFDSDSASPVHLVVVDNSEDEIEEKKLRLSLSSSVTLLVSPENIGFGPACNMAFERFPCDQILLINPDARLLPGCLYRLQQTLCSIEKAGAVSPKVFWDDSRHFNLPPSYPSHFMQVQSFLDVQRPRFMINVVSALWRAHAIKVWRSKTPIKVTSLSGGLVLLNARAVRRAGGLFDPRFFLYFEDTDLSVRLRKAGFDIVIDPEAQAIHYYDQCGRQAWEAKRAMMDRSRQMFMKKHVKGWKSRLWGIVRHFKPLGHAGRSKRTLPEFTSPFELNVPPGLRRGWLFEWSPNPTFLPSAGWLGSGAGIHFDKNFWAMLAPGRYFGRLGKPVAFSKYSHVWSWVVGG